MRFIPKHETVQKYGAILPNTLTNQAMKESEAYKTYHDFTTVKVIPKPKYVRRSTREKTDQAPITSTGKRLKAIAKVAKTGKKKQPAQGLETLSEIALFEAEQMKIVTKRSKTQFHSSHTSGSGADEGTDSSDEEDDNEVSISKDDDDDAENEDDDVTQGDNVEGEELDKEETNEDEEVNELYRDVNVNLERRDTEMTDALQTNVQDTQDIEDTHVIITAITPEVQQQSSSVSSGFISNMLNPNLDTGIDSILNLNTESTSLVDFLVTMNVEMPPSSQTNQFAEAFSSIPGIVDTYLANKMNKAVKAAVQLQSDKLRSEVQADNEDFINKINENMKKIIKEQVKVQVKEQVSKILPKIEKFVNDQLEAEVLIRSSNEAKTSHAQKTLYKALVDAYETDKDILETCGDTVMFKRRRDDEDEDEEPSAGSNRGSKRIRVRKEPESTSAPKEKTSKSTGKSKQGSKSHQTSTGKSAQAEEPIHADKDLEEPAHQEFDTGFTEDQHVDETTRLPDWFQKPTKPPTPDRDWNKTLPAVYGPVQPWISTLAWNEDPRESFNELMDIPLDFSAFVLNRLKVVTLTPELLAGPTFELMKGSCKSLVELEYFLEEIN
ncbi:hypothetical protein Tco_0771643 [Tanacetum coccineum]|uniref:Uncharacterized protein n=1 Tax=Tanacetum coccineum TaxID=301880 RepID=A0ABQ4ZJ79_9ASTR